MIITSTVGKIDATIGRFEGPIMAFMEKEEGDFAADSLKKVLYNVKTSKHYSESVSGLTGLGDFVATDGAVPYDDFQENYSKTFIHDVFKKGIEIKRETIDDAIMIDMENQSGNLIDSYNRTVEKFVHAPFNFCEQTSFTLAGKSFTNTCWDGLALAHNAHTSKTGKGGTLDNLTTLPFNTTNLKLVEEMMKNFTIDNGEKGNWKVDTIICPFELRNDVWEVCMSTGKVNSGDNNANPYKDKFKIIVSDWLDDADRWFACDSRAMKRSLFWLDRVPLEIKSDRDFNTGNWKIKGYSRWSLGASDFRWLIANIPS